VGGGQGAAASDRGGTAALKGGRDGFGRRGFHHVKS
jgi:hypothetical protein